MSFFIPCVHEHASLSCPPLSRFCSALPKDPFPSFGRSMVSRSNLYLGSLGVFLTKARLSFLYSFRLSLRPMAHLFMRLGFHLPISNGHWLTDWAFLILEGPLILDFNTCNMLDLNNGYILFFFFFFFLYEKKNGYILLCASTCKTMHFPFGIL